MKKAMLGDDDRSTTAPEGKQQFLTPNQVAMINEALNSLGDYGELRLVVEKGRLRFVITHKSFDVSKWTQGTIQGKTR